MLWVITCGLLSSRKLNGSSHVETTINFLVFEVQRQDADHPEPNFPKISNNAISNRWNWDKLTQSLINDRPVLNKTVHSPPFERDGLIVHLGLNQIQCFWTRELAGTLIKLKNFLYFESSWFRYLESICQSNESGKLENLTRVPKVIYVPPYIFERFFWILTTRYYLFIMPLFESETFLNPHGLSNLTQNFKNRYYKQKHKKWIF